VKILLNTKENKNYIHSRIGLRLSIYAVSLSLFFTFISIVFLVYIESKDVDKNLETNVSEAVQTIEKQLAKHLWDVDEESVKTTLESLEKLFFIKKARINNYLDLGIKSTLSISDVDAIYPISFKGEVLGDLEISYNTEEFKSSFYDKYKKTAMFLFVIISLMGFVFYHVVNSLLIRHITYISKTRKISSFDNVSEYIPLALSRKPRTDELSDLVDVLNEGKRIAVELLKAKKEYQEQIEYQASFDLLTGLPNRRDLYRYLTTQIDQYKKNLGKLVIMFIDLDGFKQVNDSVGHSVGDKVLQECAIRLKSVADELNGYISRLGGDEFIICFYAKQKNDYKSSAKKTINVFSKKINANGIHAKLGCSIGITIYPDHHLDDPNQLIRNADNALYKAKSAGRNAFFCFDETSRNELVFEQKVKDKLIDAIENKRFEIYYQPLIDIQDNIIIGFEALLRWHDVELGWVAPDIFIPVAEKMGVIFDIDTWVFENAINQIKIWRKEFNKDFVLSVNFSPTNFYHGEFSSWIEKSEIFNDQCFDWVELEVTERLVLNNDAIVFDGINQLRGRGIKFSIDDFGVGYSSLAYIKNFSHVLSKIKIDRMFINELLSADFNIAFVKSIMMLSNSLGLQVLAEGVENKEQVLLLKKLDCRYVQGYHFSKPLPVRDAENFFIEWDAKNVYMISSDHPRSSDTL
jgi:diguanylate cyclase (GGDEF)-like protein